MFCVFILKVLVFFIVIVIIIDVFFIFVKFLINIKYVLFFIENRFFGLNRSLNLIFLSIVWLILYRCFIIWLMFEFFYIFWLFNEIVGNFVVNIWIFVIGREKVWLKDKGGFLLFVVVSVNLMIGGVFFRIFRGMGLVNISFLFFICKNNYFIVKRSDSKVSVIF